MILPDVNVLLYAFRTDVPEHPKHKIWLERVTDEQTFGISPQALASVLRIATQRRLFAQPSSLTEALSFASALLGHPHCQVIEPGPRHWDIFTNLCRTANARGNLVQDAWFAALAIESGCEWITNDRDYAKFPGLKWPRVLTKASRRSGRFFHQQVVHLSVKLLDRLMIERPARWPRESGMDKAYATIAPKEKRGRPGIQIHRLR